MPIQYEKKNGNIRELLLFFEFQFQKGTKKENPQILEISFDH